MINCFGKDFNDLPQEIQKEIILQNTIYYQKILSNLIIYYNKLYINYINKSNEYEELKKPQSIMIHYIEIYENKNKEYNKEEVNNAYKELTEYYKPLVFQLKKNINEKKQLLYKKREEIEKFKKLYYYFYNKYKNI